MNKEFCIQIYDNFIDDDGEYYFDTEEEARKFALQRHEICILLKQFVDAGSNYVAVCIL